MDIRLDETREFDRDALQDLFRSVEWDSANYPDALQECLRGSHTVVSAWIGERLVGLANAISDGCMTAYAPYVLVRPEFQGQGVGRLIMERLVERYRDLPRLALISYDNATGFYERCGFTRGDGKTPMFRTSLLT